MSETTTKPANGTSGLPAVIAPEPGEMPAPTRGTPFEQDTIRLATAMARSGYFKDARDVAQAAVKILAGRELGFGPVASMTGIYVVEGKVTLSANLIGAAIKRSGRYDFRAREVTAKRVEIAFFDRGEAIGTSEFTFEEAVGAGLSTKDVWKKYPRNMLFARALSNGAKWFCPDVFGGPVYTPEELGVAVNEDGEPLDATPPQAARAVIEQQAPAIASPTGLRADQIDSVIADAEDNRPEAAPASAGPAGATQPDTTPPPAAPEWEDLGNAGTLAGPRWASTPLGRRVSELIDQGAAANLTFSPPDDDADDAALEGWIKSKSAALNQRTRAT